MDVLLFFIGFVMFGFIILGGLSYFVEPYHTFIMNFLPDNQYNRRLFGIGLVIFLILSIIFGYWMYNYVIENAYVDALARQQIVR